MKPNTCLVIDTWEGQLEIDEAVLKANGVAGIGIRLNDMNGGHHMDTLFQKQWDEARNFVRFPYFVYNPWVDGPANFVWLKSHMPSEAKSVAIDIEVKYPNYPTNKYAGEVVKFLDMCKTQWKTIIYTAQWFLPYLSSWPRVDYWWAQYPDSGRYFGTVKTWDDLKIALDNPSLEKPFNASVIPGILKMWQFSGDYLTLPGNTRKMDVNIFYGTEDDLADYFGTAVIDPKPEPKPEPKSSSYYIFSRASYWKRPLQGPLVTPHYNITKTSGDKDSLIKGAILSWMQKMNTARQWAKVIAKDWGPSKGFNSNGYLILNSLVYPGRNIVQIQNVFTGIDGNKWGELVSIDLNSNIALDSSINYIDTPHLVHTVYGSNSNWTYSVLTNAPYVPLVADGKRYIQMEWLEPITFPKTVKITAVPFINVRSTPTTYTPNGTNIVAKKLYGTSVIVTDMIVSKGGIWGKIDGGWIALRNNNNNLTDWKI